MIFVFLIYQNSDPVRRQRGAHVEREEPWEHSFNFSIVLQPAILMFIEWCYLDVRLNDEHLLRIFSSFSDVQLFTTVTAHPLSPCLPPPLSLSLFLSHSVKFSRELWLPH